MIITAELLDKDIAGLRERINMLQQQFEQVKAMLAQTSGSLSTLEEMRKFLDKTESDLAVPIEEIAEAVAGPGATVEIEEIKDPPVNANGGYNRRGKR